MSTGTKRERFWRNQTTHNGKSPPALVREWVASWGYPVRVPGYERLLFFVEQHGARDWAVTESRSGWKAGAGDTRREAVANLEKNVRTYTPRGWAIRLGRIEREQGKTPPPDTVEDIVPARKAKL